MLRLFTLRRLAQVFRGRANDAERRRQMHVEHRLPLLVGHLMDGAVPGVAGIVNDGVNPAVAVEGRLN